MTAQHLAQSKPRHLASVGVEQPAREATLVERAHPVVLPTGTVTFVLADVEGSVRLWELKHESMAAAIGRFGALVPELVDRHRGVRPVEQGEGDSFVAAFAVAGDAVAFILELQRTLAAADWANVLPLRVRAAVHTGATQLRGVDNYMGPTINRCARIRALAHGGQVLLSTATCELAADALGEGVSFIDQGVQALRDFERPEHVFQLAHPELEDHFPPLREKAAEARRLPSALTAFIARSDEMASVVELLGRSRLVTLTGAGGSGKTRLALECARQAGGGARVVAWADAAPIADGALVTSCVAGALNVREVAAEPLIETVVRELGGREVLLILDNCEHVIEDAAFVVERMLQGCPGLRVLATSREPIGVEGETSMRVPSLEGSDAVALFVDRAKAVRPEFVLSSADQDAVTEICRRLGGIPLAIELAAARVRVLTPQQIAAGLADRFRLLTGGARTALPRQRTLEASVDWSYRLLSDDERRLLDRISTFAGGFTLEATERVCANEELPEPAILDLLTALVDKSLVQVDGEGSGIEVRYRMLETIRHFAHQRLADAVDGGIVRDQHLAYFLGLAEEIGPLIQRGDELVWLERLDADLDNLRAALDWAELGGDSKFLIRLAGALWLFWELRCRFEEGCLRLRTALDSVPEPTRERAIALHGLGDISIFTLDIATVTTCGVELLDLGERLDDAAVRVRGKTLLGWAASFGAYRDTTWALKNLAEAVNDARREDDPWLQMDAAIAMNLAATNEGDLRVAQAAADEALVCATQRRSVGGLQRALCASGLSRLIAGDVNAGEDQLLRAMLLAEDLNDTFWHALALSSAGRAKFLRGDLTGAEADGREAAVLGERFGNSVAVALAGAELAIQFAAKGEDEQARHWVDAVAPIAEETAQSWIDVRLASALAVVDARQGDIVGARERLGVATNAVGIRPYQRGLAALARGRVERVAGDDSAAEAAFIEAVRSLADAGARADLADALDELAVSAARRNQPGRAARLLGAAEAERSLLGIVKIAWVGLPDANEVLAAIGPGLGDELEAEIEAGRAKSLDEAVHLALRGKGGRRRSKSGWESLTPAESEVVRLVSEGMTNPRIAEKLLITSGTVKAHLSHIFTKLGVGSRSELAAEAARRDTADPT